MTLAFPTPGTHYVAGSTGCGKSQYVGKLIHYRDQMFNESPSGVFYAYTEWQEDLFGRLQKQENVVFHEGLPNLQTIRGWSESVGGRHILLVLDDLQQAVTSSPDMVHLFSAMSHHLNISPILVTQNLFPRGRCARDLSLNCHFLALFDNKRDRLQLSTLGRQLYPGENRFFMSCYNDAVGKAPYSFLLVDMHPSTPREYMLRGGIFPDELTVVYQAKK